MSGAGDIMDPNMLTPGGPLMQDNSIFNATGKLPDVNAGLLSNIEEQQRMAALEHHKLEKLEE
jgi:hypothetical protein